MSTKLLINQEGLNLIKFYEGFEPVPYNCSGGKLTIGFGHVILPNEKFNSITKKQATELLLKDIIIAEQAVNRLITVKLNRNQFSALVSFVFNLGFGNFESSTLLKVVNAQDHLDVPNELIKWRNAAGKPLLGLLRRRLAESVLYLS